ncbi:MAG: calcium/sodium antiporter [Phycisphaerales bacterium JB059]
MSVLLSIIWLALGIALLVGGSEALVRGAAHLARLLGMRPFVIGVTVVAFGTSAPELAASIGFSLSGQSEAAITNVVGSNIANIGLILGLTALLKAVPVSRTIFRRDAPIMVGASVLASLTLLDLRVTRLEGAFLTAGILLYVWVTYRMGRTDPEAIRHELDREREHGLDLIPPEEPKRAWLNLALILAGLMGLLLGSRLVVTGAMDLAMTMGIPPALVSLTMVAFGTSLPELAACAVAARKGEPEIALGNVVGSNVFNLLSVMGISACVRPLSAPGDIWAHLGVMLGLSVGMMVVSGPRLRVGRLGGGVLLLAYLAYVIVVYTRNPGV